MKQIFHDPGAEYTIIPLWFLNGDLNEAELLRQLRDFKDKGIDGIVLHPRMGLSEKLDYMGPAYLSMFRFIAENARKLDMKIVLYDEGMYPSGSANGQVVRSDPAFAARGLRMASRELDGSRPMTAPLEAGENLVLAAAVKKAADGTVDLSTAVKIPESGDFTLPDNGDWIAVWLIAAFSGGTIRGIHFGEDDGEKNAPPAADILNPAAVKRFIELTHEKYYAALRPYFGKTIRAIFTDEPDVLGRCVNKRKVKPWTPGFLKWYTDLGNKDTDLIALFFDVGKETEAKRSAFHRAVNARLGVAYYGQLSDWCVAHGISLTGHPQTSEDIGMLRYFQIPGQDLVWRWVAPEDNKGIEGLNSTLAKCSSDAARHAGKRRNADECFGCCGPDGRQWELSAGDMKWFMDWLFVRGVNLLYPHAFLYSTDGEKRTNERPPDVGPNNSWWRYYRHFALYAKRMSYIMTDSVNTTSIAVLCEENFLPWQIAEPLYRSQIEFNYLESSLLLSGCTISGGQVSIQNQRYDTILVENTGSLKEEVAEKLCHFAEKGGKVIFYDPERKFRLGVAKRITDFSELPALLDDRREWKIAPANADARFSHVKKGGSDFYVLVNEGEQTIRGTASIHAAGSLEKWDTMTGDTQPIALTGTQNGWSSFPFELNRRESVIICVDANGAPAMGEAAQPVISKSLDLSKNWEIALPDGRTLTEENLASWVGIPGMRDYSGTVAFSKSAELEALDGAKKITLDLGNVGEMAELAVNGKPVGVKMWAPYTFEIPVDTTLKTLKLEVKVTNSIANRMSKAATPSGLLGPVTLTLYK